MTKYNFLQRLFRNSVLSFTAIAMSFTAVADAVTPSKYKLEVLAVSGSVDYKAGSSLTRPIIIGELLQSVGDRIITHEQSSAVLQLNKTIAQVNLSANTELVIRSFTISRNGGLISQLALNSGQAQFQVPAFKNPESNFQISTPGGTVTVKNGATYSLSIAPNGKTTVVSLDGTVIATSNKRSVSVQKGFYTFIAPGLPPNAPMPTSDRKVSLRLGSCPSWARRLEIFPRNSIGEIGFLG